ncbi:MAG: hypothetical protein WCK86_10845 [Planctomycetia bacterium]
MSVVKFARGTSRATAPHIKLTKYDVAVSVLQTSAFIALLTFAVMLAIWLSNMLPAPVSRKVELMPAGDGGWEDGTPDATPNVESPEDAVPDPSLANEETDVTQIEEVIEQVIEVAENAAVIEAPNEARQQQNTGIPGSADGTGGRPLGSGGPGRGGAKREQGWIVEFADKGDLDSYAAQLDFFGIELGLLLKEDSRLIYLSNMSRPSPTQREVRTGEGEKRLFLNWQDGSQDRVKADMELFKKAGLDASNGVILHFYPAATEQILAQLEVSYGNQQPSAVRKTYFQVRRAGSGFEFVVTRQVLK